MTDKATRIREAIEAFNANPARPVDDFYGRQVPHFARGALLATDCDYEIVTVSGVRGMMLPQEGEAA